MENRRRFILCTCIVLVLLTAIVAVCIAENSDEPVTLRKPTAVYQEAVNRLNGQENIQLHISYDKSTAMGTQIFRERSQQTLTYEGLGTDEMKGYMEQELLIGEYPVSITELFSDGTGYFTVDGNGFQGSMTQEEYMARYIPAATVSPELYAKVQGTSTKKEAVIRFTYGAAAESWAAKSGMKDIASEAIVYLDTDGNLTKTEYLLSYVLQDAKISITATVEIQQPEQITLPDNLENYTPVAYLDGPRELEIACGHLLTANCATAAYTDTISCEAFGDIRKQSIDVSTCSTDAWNARVDTKVTLENNSKQGIAATTQKTETFENNTYTVQIDGGSPTTGDVSAKDMQSYCHDILVATIMLPDHITDAKVSQTDNAYHIEYTGNEDFAKMLSDEACVTLYQKADTLTMIAQSYDTNSVSCYLTVDKVTGLPTASGFSYDGTYIISDLPYKLSYQADQSYDLLTEE